MPVEGYFSLTDQEKIVVLKRHIRMETRTLYGWLCDLAELTDDEFYEEHQSLPLPGFRGIRIIARLEKTEKDQIPSPSHGSTTEGELT